MVAAVEFIPSYEQEKDHDEMLLKFAKLSFKLVQLQYIQELKIVTKYVISLFTSISIDSITIFKEVILTTFSISLDARWYKEQEFASKFPPYFRDKIVENYFFVLGVFFEPQFSRARIMCTQFFTILEINDDTFDRYASLPEAVSLANSLERYTLCIKIPYNQ